MPKKDLADCFENPNELITALSSNVKEVIAYVTESAFIGRLLPRDSEPEEDGFYDKEFRREDIVNAMVEAGIVRKPNSLWGRHQVKRNLNRAHQTNYYRRYSFVRVKGKSDCYRIKLDETSGIE